MTKIVYWGSLFYIRWNDWKGKGQDGASFFVFGMVIGGVDIYWVDLFFVNV